MDTQSRHPVFETPDMAYQTMARERPVDLVRLARQTGGDRALEEEVLHLFLKQAKSIGKAMRVGTDADQRKRHAHTLKGAAHAVGAGAIADTAKAVEDLPGERRCVRALLTEIDRTCDYINSLLR
ncbi:Hpt domain-containing protein [Oceaniradius stylonematis]|uniref:Hpt domain-containing protein n=1 Tax=Oceaniradius stylonematis TaxID=2184161 RepID=UPI0035CEAE8E